MASAPTNDELQFTNAPNLLTLGRVILVPVVVALLFVREPAYDFAASMVFAVASITDYFDGYLARRQKLITVYGKLMDPLADKFLVVSCLIMLQQLGRVHPVVNMLLICRELGITSLRALASAEGVVIAASTGAKWKTTFQMVAIGILIGYPFVESVPLEPIGQVLLYLSLALSLISAKDYAVDFFRELRGGALRRREARLARKQARQERQEGRRKALLERFSRRS